VSQKDRDAAKQCLIRADKFLKESDFEQSREEVAKAQKLDPSNPYSYAFLDRITYFEEQSKKETTQQESEASKKKSEEEAAAKEAAIRKAEEEAKKKAEEEAGRKAEEAKRKAEEEAKRREEEAKKKAAEREKLAASIQKIEELRRRRVEEDNRKKADEEAKKKAEEEARRKAEEEAKRKAEEEARRKADEEARKKAEEQTRKKIEEEVRRKLAEEAKQKAEEEARKKSEEEAKRKAEEAKRKAEEEARRKADEETRKKADAEAARKRAVNEALERTKAEVAKREAEQKKRAEGSKKLPDVDDVMEAARPVISDVMAGRSAPSIGDVLQDVKAHKESDSPNIDVKLNEMRRQIEMLTNALEQERKVREEMNQQQLKGSIKQLRASMEKAWVNGVPSDDELEVLHDLAASLGIPDDVEQTLQREVKLEMYARAVKEIVSKQKLIRNSSRTLEWIRKVYQVTMDEYLEYESKFLMDLVADQYKGTILLVSSHPGITKELGNTLKSSGYAVVPAISPENALEKIEKITPHYILCDMEFSQGHLSGIKFLHVLRANSKFNYIPIILMCEEKEVSQLEKSELRPTEGYVEKPVDIESLNAVMNEKMAAFREYLSSI